MRWPGVFIVLVVSHLVGDFVVQTDWQAMNKKGGLTGTAVQRRALAAHVLTYTLSYTPALVWLWGRRHWEVFAIAALVAVPHWIQDDGALLFAYARRFKGADLPRNPPLALALDQVFHVVALFATALFVSR